MESTLSLILKHQKLLVSSHGTLVPLTLSLSQYLSLSLSLSPHTSAKAWVTRHTGAAKLPECGGGSATTIWKETFQQSMLHGAVMCGATGRKKFNGCTWLAECAASRWTVKSRKLFASVLGFILSLLNLTGEILIENTIKYPKIEKKIDVSCILEQSKGQHGVASASRTNLSGPAQSPLDLRTRHWIPSPFDIQLIQPSPKHTQTHGWRSTTAWGLWFMYIYVSVCISVCLCA